MAQEGWISMWGTEWRVLHKLRPHRLLPAAEWPVWHMLHEPAASNCQLATEDRPNGLLASGSRLQRFVKACQPAACRVARDPWPPAHLPVGPCFLSLPAGQLPAATCQNTGLALSLSDLLSRSDPALLPELDWWLSGCGGFVREARNGPAFVVRADGMQFSPPQPQPQTPLG